tara:strand:- start:1356 stop:1832 length:477 start_codon:yes stop_codon:yes gene_type:complete
MKTIQSLGHKNKLINRPFLIAAIALFIAAGGCSSSTSAEKFNWLEFSGETVNSLQNGGQTVFIDFTAEWCLTCKVNEKTVIYTDDVRKVFKKYNIAAVKADYTNDNKEIGQWLHRFKRAGIPLYVILPPTNKPNKKIVVLPEILTKDMLIENLKKVAG